MDSHKNSQNIPSSSPESSPPKTIKPVSPPQYTQYQKERIQRNRQRALALRQSRPAAHSQPAVMIGEEKERKEKGKGVEEDTHGGFFLEEESEEEGPVRKKRLIHDKVPSLFDKSEWWQCEECTDTFYESFLWNKFKCPVCDQCRDSQGKHALITKTEAKQRFLLQDCDFEERGGSSLPYLLKRNPHSSRGDMKLYMISQVMERSHSLWNGEKGLEEERERREETKEKRKRKQFTKQIKNLRKSVYKPSLSSSSHSHSYTEEQYNSSDDNWTKTCTECGHSLTYEKL